MDSFGEAFFKFSIGFCYEKIAQNFLFYMQVTWPNKTCFKKATKMDLQSGGKNWQKTAESNADQNSMDDFIFGFF